MSSQVRTTPHKHIHQVEYGNSLLAPPAYIQCRKLLATAWRSASKIRRVHRRSTYVDVRSIITHIRHNNTSDFAEKFLLSFQNFSGNTICTVCMGAYFISKIPLTVKNLPRWHVLATTFGFTGAMDHCQKFLASGRFDEVMR